MSNRVTAALDILARPQVRSQDIAAIGYCFGGTCVLDSPAAVRTSRA